MAGIERATSGTGESDAAPKGIDYTRSKAVQKVKGLPRNNNVRIRVCIYKCRFCLSFTTTGLTSAWVHTMIHGPWESMGSQAHAEMNAKPPPAPRGRPPLSSVRSAEPNRSGHRIGSPQRVGSKFRNNSSRG